jgi:hypothetical protein
MEEGRRDVLTCLLFLVNRGNWTKNYITYQQVAVMIDIVLRICYDLQAVRLVVNLYQHHDSCVCHMSEYPHSAFCPHRALFGFVFFSQSNDDYFQDSILVRYDTVLCYYEIRNRFCLARQMHQLRPVDLSLCNHRCESFKNAVGIVLVHSIEQLVFVIETLSVSMR